MRDTARPTSSAAYDWASAAVASSMGLGAYIDGWAHNHALATGRTIETFFTPWHALLYGGYGLVVLLLAATHVYWTSRGYQWKKAIPHGYVLTVAGAAIFAAGGAFDMIWHIMFGIEVSTEALLSPSHIILVVGAVLIYMGPARSVVTRLGGRSLDSWIDNGPFVLSLLWLLSSFTFFTQYASPFSSTLASTARKPVPDNADFRDLLQSFAVAGLVLQSAFLSGVVLYGLKFKRLPFGSFAAIIGLNALLVTHMRADYLTVSPAILSIGAALAGLLADVLYARLRPQDGGFWPLKIFGFCVPAIVYALYFSSIVAFGGTYWSIHLILGSVLTAGIVGLLLTFLMPGPKHAAESV